MSNNYSDATGVLVLDRITPVITALFGGFNLDETYPGDGDDVHRPDIRRQRSAMGRHPRQTWSNCLPARPAVPRG